jgi:hypothetical protein
MGWAAFWAIFSQTHLVTLLFYSGIVFCFLKKLASTIMYVCMDPSRFQTVRLCLQNLSPAIHCLEQIDAIAEKDK